jgi:hypothetical protein
MNPLRLRSHLGCDAGGMSPPENKPTHNFPGTMLCPHPPVVNPLRGSRVRTRRPHEITQ